MTKSMIEYLVLMSAFFVFFFLLFYLLHRFKEVKMGKNKLLKVIGGLSIGSKEKIITLKVHNKIILLGVTPGQINTLYVCEDTNEDCVGIKERHPQDLTFIEEFQKMTENNRKQASEKTV